MLGSGNVITEQRGVHNYHAVALSGIGELTIDQNGNEGLTIEAEDNIVPAILTEVRDGVLHIGPDKLALISPTRPLKFYLSARGIDAINVSGAGSARSARLESSSMRLSISGAGSVDIGNLSSRDLAVHVSGSGRVVLASGNASSQQVDISGSGEYRAADVASSVARVSISGAGAVTLRVSETLDARISGAGSVRYIGNPTITKHVSGVGSITKLSDN